MTLRTIKGIFPAYRDDIGDLQTVRPLPSPQVQLIDPFLFLNHHGPQVYPAPNRGLPFGPHPHRGFQTVTFILDGDIAHRDSRGHESVIEAGGVQWMSAGRGLVHEEVSSERFKETGGPLEILQLWINLPARYKMSDPYYIGLQRNEIPIVTKADGKVQVKVVAGSFDGQQGPFKPSTDISSFLVELKAGGSFELTVHPERNIFFYVVRGNVEVNGATVKRTNLVQFDHDGEELGLKALEDSFVLICHASPYREPVVAQGPFVMNSREEIIQAFQDFQSGRFS